MTSRGRFLEVMRFGQPDRVREHVSYENYRYYRELLRSIIEKG
jgi:hypothetical protein